MELAVCGVGVVAGQVEADVAGSVARGGVVGGGAGVAPAVGAGVEGGEAAVLGFGTELLHGVGVWIDAGEEGKGEVGGT